MCVVISPELCTCTAHAASLSSPPPLLPPPAPSKGMTTFQINQKRRAAEREQMVHSFYDNFKLNAVGGQAMMAAQYSQGHREQSGDKPVSNML